MSSIDEQATGKREVVKSERAAIVRHSVDSIVIVLLSLTIVLAVWSVGERYCETVGRWIGSARLSWLALVGIVAAVGIGWCFPRGVIAVWRGMTLVPRHWGLAVRAMLGWTMLILSGNLLGLLEYTHISAGVIWICGIVAEAVVLCVAGGAARFALCLRKLQEENWAKKGKYDDRPIHTLEENDVPAFEEGARRILERLELGRNEGGRGPNIAVIGGYGSGKTSLCNLVQCISEEKQSHKDRGELVFCRFEAWQYLTAEGAVRGLLDVIVRKVEELVDCWGLRGVSEEYVDVLRGIGGRWFDVFAVLLGRRRSADEIMEALQDVLGRVGKRVVVFVDDFDRLESRSGESQDAVAGALNQLQNLTNVQYVLCVGPVRDGVCGDLLKLTRFQETVPRVSGKKVVESIRKLRDEVIGETSNYYVWTLVNREGDPLKYSPWTMDLQSMMVSQLCGLIQTLRQVRTVVREVKQKWDEGLKGEISWYDLLLMSTLKVCEPKVWEWIVREPERFLYEGIQIKKPTEEDKKKIREDIERELNDLLDKKTPKRFELTSNIIVKLFPRFMKSVDGLVGSLTRREPEAWRQEISSQYGWAESYLDRYLWGGVRSGEIADQPTLRFIHSCVEKGFSRDEFESRYLGSYERVTNDLNKFVQFSSLLPIGLAMEVCDCMLDWFCDREHWKVWKEGEDKYIQALMPDAGKILEGAGRLEWEKALSRGDGLDAASEKKQKWIEEHLRELASRDVIVAEMFRHVFKESLGGKGESLNLLGNHIRDVLLKNPDATLEKCKQGLYYLIWMLNTLCCCDDYESIKGKVTEMIIEKMKTDKSGEFAASVVMALMSVLHPAGKDDDVDRYEFRVDKSANERRLDMKRLLPVVLGLTEDCFGDEVVKRGYGVLVREYGADGRTRTDTDECG